jgi:hypothetical protein
VIAIEDEMAQSSLEDVQETRNAHPATDQLALDQNLDAGRGAVSTPGSSWLLDVAATMLQLLASFAP